MFTRVKIRYYAILSVLWGANLRVVSLFTTQTSQTKWNFLLYPQKRFSPSKFEKFRLLWVYFIWKVQWHVWHDFKSNSERLTIGVGCLHLHRKLFPDTELIQQPLISWFVRTDTVLIETCFLLSSLSRFVWPITSGP